MAVDTGTTVTFLFIVGIMLQFVSLLFLMLLYDELKKASQKLNEMVEILRKVE